MNQLSLCLFLPLWKTAWKQWGLLLYNGCVFCLWRANACLSLSPWLLWVSSAADCSPDGRGRAPWDCRVPSVVPWKPPGCSLSCSLCTEPSVLCTRGLSHLARQQGSPFLPQNSWEQRCFCELTVTGEWTKMHTASHRKMLFQSCSAMSAKRLCSRKLRELSAQTRSDKSCICSCHSTAWMQRYWNPLRKQCPSFT